MTHRSITLLAMVALLVLSACGTVAIANNEYPSPTPIPSPLPTPTLWYEHFDFSTFPPDKREDARQLLATIGPFIGTVPTPLPNRHIKTRPAGIGTICEVRGYVIPNMMRQYDLYNRWIAETPTEYMTVYAGCHHDNPEQGIVHVDYQATGYVASPPRTRPAVTVASPVPGGCLKIIDGHDMQLVLITTGVSATQQLTFTFDVDTATFVP